MSILVSCRRKFAIFFTYITMFVTKLKGNGKRAVFKDFLFYFNSIFKVNRIAFQISKDPNSLKTQKSNMKT